MTGNLPVLELEFQTVSTIWSGCRTPNFRALPVIGRRRQLGARQNRPGSFKKLPRMKLSLLDWAREASLEHGFSLERGVRPLLQI